MIFILKKWFSLPQWQQILLGLIVGSLVGLILRSKATLLLPIGTVFIRLIQMLVVPVVMTAIVCAVTSLKELNKMGRMVIKALTIYGITMAIAATIGILIANLFKVGLDFPMQTIVNGINSLPPKISFGDILVGFVPKSPVAAFAENNVMQVFCFAFIFGVALNLSAEKGKPIRDLFLSLSEVVFLFAKIVVSFAPYGIFALMACVTGKYGVGVLLPLIKMVCAVYTSCIILIIVIFSICLMLNRINPVLFIRRIAEPLMTAFTTSSSAATLPVTMRCARENLKINKSVSDFLLPLGTTLNLNGLAIYLSVATIFAANMYGVSLTTAQYITMVISIVFTAVGAAAIPGSGLIVMSAVMSSVGVPLTAMPIIAGVDRFNDMIQTMTNVTGDLFATTLVAKSEKMIH